MPDDIQCNLLDLLYQEVKGRRWLVLRSTGILIHGLQTWPIKASIKG